MFRKKRKTKAKKGEKVKSSEMRKNDREGKHEK